MRPRTLFVFLSLCCMGLVAVGLPWHRRERGAQDEDIIAGKAFLDIIMSNSHLHAHHHQNHNNKRSSSTTSTTTEKSQPTPMMIHYLTTPKHITARKPGKRYVSSKRTFESRISGSTRSTRSKSDSIKLISAKELSSKMPLMQMRSLPTSTLTPPSTTSSTAKIKVLSSTISSSLFDGDIIPDVKVLSTLSLDHSKSSTLNLNAQLVSTSTPKVLTTTSTSTRTSKTYGRVVPTSIPYDKLPSLLNNHASSKVDNLKHEIFIEEVLPVVSNENANKATTIFIEEIPVTLKNPKKENVKLPTTSIFIEEVVPSKSQETNQKPQFIGVVQSPNLSTGKVPSVELIGSLFTPELLESKTRLDKVPSVSVASTSDGVDDKVFSASEKVVYFEKLPEVTEKVVLLEKPLILELGVTEKSQPKMAVLPPILAKLSTPIIEEIVTSSTKGDNDGDDNFSVVSTKFNIDEISSKINEILKLSSSSKKTLSSPSKAKEYEILDNSLSQVTKIDGRNSRSVVRQTRSTPYYPDDSSGKSTPLTEHPIGALNEHERVVGVSVSSSTRRGKISTTTKKSTSVSVTSTTTSASKDLSTMSPEEEVTPLVAKAKQSDFGVEEPEPITRSGSTVNEYPANVERLPSTKEFYQENLPRGRSVAYGAVIQNLPSSSSNHDRQERHYEGSLGNYNAGYVKNDTKTEIKQQEINDDGWSTDNSEPTERNWGVPERSYEDFSTPNFGVGGTTQRQLLGQFSADQKQFGADQKQFGADQKQFGADQKRFGEDQKRFGEDQKRFGQDQAQFLASQKQFVADQAQFVQQQQQQQTKPFLGTTDNINNNHKYSSMYTSSPGVDSYNADMYAHDQKYPPQNKFTSMKLNNHPRLPLLNYGGQPEQNYEVDESVSVMSNGRVHGVQPSQSTTTNHNPTSSGGKKDDNDKKVGYVVEGRNYRKYRVEERTSDGFIVGEYGVVSHDDGSLRGVRYTADGTINPRLIYDALMKFLAL